MHKRQYVLGLLAFAAGAAAFLYAAPKMDYVRSTLGQLAVAFGGQQVAEQAQVWQLIYYGGIVGIILGGILLLAGLIQHVTQSSYSLGAQRSQALPSTGGPPQSASPNHVPTPVAWRPSIPDSGKVVETIATPIRTAWDKLQAVAVPARAAVEARFSLRLSTGASFPLEDGVRLRARDIWGQGASSDGLVAEVARHPADASVLGLKNLTRQSWLVTLASHEQRQVEPGRSVKLAQGTRIEFGSVQGEILE